MLFGTALTQIGENEPDKHLDLMNKLTRIINLEIRINNLLL